MSDDIVLKRIDVHSSVVKPLIIIGNYLENVKKIKPPIHWKTYEIVCSYYYGVNTLRKVSVKNVMKGCKDVWAVSKKDDNLFYLKDEYKLSEDTTIKLLSKTQKLVGTESLYYTIMLFQTIDIQQLMAILLLADDKNIFYKVVNIDKKYKEVLKELIKKGLVKKTKGGYILTSKGWKVYYIFKELVSILGDKNLLGFVIP